MGISYVEHEDGGFRTAVSRFEDCVDKDETFQRLFLHGAMGMMRWEEREKPLEAFKTYLPLLLTQLQERRGIITRLKSATRADDVNP